MSTNLSFGRDINGFNAYAPATATNKWSATITDGNETHITVPSNHSTWVVSFSYQPGGDVWVDLTGATAAIPAGATLAATTAELNPASRTVLSGAKISMITGQTSCDVGVSLYAVASI